MMPTLETYYYLFSVALLLMSLLHIFNMVYFKRTGKLLTGKRFRPGTPEYKAYDRLATSYGLILSVLVLGVVGANLVYSVYALAQAKNIEHFEAILIFGPIFNIIVFTAVILFVRREHGDSNA